MWANNLINCDAVSHHRCPDRPSIPVSVKHNPGSVEQSYPLVQLELLEAPCNPGTVTRFGRLGPNQRIDQAAFAHVWIPDNANCQKQR
jgi:hypothetical protein